MKKVESKEDRATVILVHGAFEHGGRYKAIVQRLHQDGFSVIYGDLPGQGGTNGKKGHIDSFVDYINTIHLWLLQANPKKKVFIIGHSMGGLAVIRTMEMLRLQVDGIVLSSPALGIKNKASLPIEALTFPLNLMAPSLRFNASQDPNIITRNPLKATEFLQDPLVIKKVSVRWYREFQKAIKLAFEEIARFPEVPLLVMQAEEDHMVEMEKTKEWFHNVPVNNKRYKQWPGLYHELYNEPEWEEVYQETLTFLEEQLL